MSDPRLDALLRDLPPPPPVPAGLQARIVDAIVGTPQEANPARARRIAARRDRRGRWLRRPLLAGTAALGLVFTSAVAATLAGVPIPQKIAAVFFPEEKAPEPKAAPVPQPRRAVRHAAAPAVPVETVETEQPGGPLADAIFRPDARPWRRLIMAQRVIDARRAMGLPTPGAERIERRLRRRAQMWREATPEQRARWVQRRQERQAERRALLATPEGRAALAERRAEAGAGPMRRWGASPGRGAALSPEQRAERQEQIRQWRAQRQAGVPPTPEQRAARQERFRQWREARRARWEARNGEVPARPREPNEGPGQMDR